MRVPRWNPGRLFRLALTATAPFLFAAVLLAQNPSAVVNGSVVDPSGAAVPDAKVIAVNQQTNVAASRSTSGDGTFSIINLLPGTYVLTVEKTGFKKVSLPAFKLD